MSSTHIKLIRKLLDDHVLATRKALRIALADEERSGLDMQLYHSTSDRVHFARRLGAAKARVTTRRRALVEAEAARDAWAAQQAKNAVAETTTVVRKHGSFNELVPKVPAPTPRARQGRS